MTNNTINDEINEMRQYLSKQLPNWEKATAETLLTALSNCDNQQVKESMIRNNPTPIRESIYDTATDGIRELNQHRIDKYRTNQNEKNRADATNWLWWLFYRIPGKAELKRRHLMF